MSHQPAPTMPHAVGTARQSSSAFYPMRNNIKTPASVAPSLFLPPHPPPHPQLLFPFTRGVCLVIPLFHREPIRRPWGVARSLTWSNWTLVNHTSDDLLPISVRESFSRASTKKRSPRSDRSPSTPTAPFTTWIESGRSSKSKFHTLDENRSHIPHL
jgi:hypothetical protein